MKKLTIFLVAVVALVACATIDDSDFVANVVSQERLELEVSAGAKRLSVLQFNIWQEGTVIPGGFDAIVAEIIRTDADLVALSEVRNYDGVHFNAKLVEALAAKGHTYYTLEDETDDTGLISKYPLVKESIAFANISDSGTVTRAVVDVDGVEVAFYSAHLDYKNCAYYEPRGYCGNSWTKIIPVTDTKKLHEMNLASRRDDAIKAFIELAKEDEEEGRLVIIGGDFNEPSWRDWIEANKDMYDHNGVVIKWDVSVMLEEAGFVDSWRELYKDPITHPGFTYPATNPDTTMAKLSWAPRADERERIDFIYYKPDSRLELLDSIILGPASSVAYFQNVKENSACPILTPEDVWPTDHKALISIFEIK